MESTDITVVGAGLIGLASAWALHQRGWRVRVIEAREQAGLETSYANSGMLTPSMADPWNRPGVWRDLLAWLGREDAPMLLRPGALPQYLGWGLRFLAHSAPSRHRIATLANFALAEASLQQFRRLRERLPLDYDLRTRGTLQLFRHAEDFDRARAHTEVLAARGLSARVLVGEACVQVEPLLAAVATQFVGAIHYTDDETGDAHRYCQGLASHLADAGVEFLFDTRVLGVRHAQARVQGLATSRGDMDTRHVVLACASHSVALARACGVHLPIRPVKGYSLTVPDVAAERLPGLSLIDHHLHAAITPFDTRLRLAGTAEFAGFDQVLRQGRIEALWDMLQRILPGRFDAADRARAIPWCGLRPMSADGVPFIGRSPVEGLYINTGQGHLGWTQSLGSGDLLAALVCGEAPPIDPAPFRVGR